MLDPQLLGGLIASIGTLVGVYITSYLNRPSRRDQLAAMIAEAKLKAYSEIWPAIHAATWAVMSDAVTRVNQGAEKARPLPLEEIQALRTAWTKHAHVAAREVINLAWNVEHGHELLKVLDQRGAESFQMMKKMVDDLSAELHEALNVLRVDCQTAEISRHTQDLFKSFKPPTSKNMDATSDSTNRSLR
jgi:hypothetical protein